MCYCSSTNTSFKNMWQLKLTLLVTLSIITMAYLAWRFFQLFGECFFDIEKLLCLGRLDSPRTLSSLKVKKIFRFHPLGWGSKSVFATDTVQRSLDFTGYEMVIPRLIYIVGWILKLRYHRGTTCSKVELSFFTSWTSHIKKTVEIQSIWFNVVFKIWREEGDEQANK